LQVPDTDMNFKLYNFKHIFITYVEPVSGQKTFMDTPHLI